METIAAALGEEAVTLEDVCEPYLMQLGYLTRTPRGRCVTRYAYEHLGMKAPGTAEASGQQTLDDPVKQALRGKWIWAQCREKHTRFVHIFSLS